MGSTPFRRNGPALLAELHYVDEPNPDAATFATIEKPTLIVAASDSPPEQREMSEAMAAAIPNARTALVEGGHLIDPAAPEVLAFTQGGPRAPLAGGGTPDVRVAALLEI